MSCCDWYTVLDCISSSMMRDSLLAAHVVAIHLAPFGQRLQCNGRCDAAQVEPGQRLDIKHHKNQVLFSGTRILQHTGDKGARVRTPDGGCLAVVLRTGFETAQGMCLISTCVCSILSINSFLSGKCFLHFSGSCLLLLLSLFFPQSCSPLVKCP